MKILVFSAHPDDAETCCGGTICRLADDGHRVHIVHLTCSSPTRAREAAAAAKILGATVEVWKLPDGGMTVEFHPNHYVNIGPYRHRKREAVACHASVNCIGVYPICETTQQMRGYESGYSYAEGFIRIAFRRGNTRHVVVGNGIQTDVKDGRG